MTKKHTIQNKKLDKLREKQNNIPTEQTMQHQFHPKIINHTDIQFTYNEIQLLNKGPKYNLQYKTSEWIKTIAIEAETAISYVEEIEQNYVRHAIAKSMKTIIEIEKEEKRRKIKTRVECIKNNKKKIKRT
jgi:hypothetical protein